MSARRRESLLAWLPPLALVFGAAVGFGAVVPDFYQVSDDLVQTGGIHDLGRGRSLSDKIAGVLFRAEGGGHFKPVQDVAYVIAYHALGPDRWLFPLMIALAMCHVASGWLLVAILRRVGCPAHLALAAALLFVVHPVWDEALGSVTSAYNVGGLTCVLGACLLFLRVPGSSPRRNAARLAAGAVLLCVAIGLAINLLVSGALLLGGIAAAVGWSTRSWRAFAVRCVALTAAVGASLLHRLLAYGAVGTKHGHYAHLEPNRDVNAFLGDVVSSAVLLRPSDFVTWTARANPPGLAWDREAPAAASEGLIVAVAALALVVVALLVATQKREGPGAEPARLAPSFWFGLCLTVAMLLPYFVFIGGIGPHRYLYPAIAGIAVMAAMGAAGAGRLIARVVPRATVAAAGALALGIALAALLRVDREAARSIAEGHRMTRMIVSAVAADVAAHPGIKHLFVVGYPRVIGRAGFTITFPGHLLALLNAKLGWRFLVNDTSFADAVGAGWLPLPLPDEVALYVVDQGGTTVWKVPKGRENQLPPHAR